MSVSAAAAAPAAPDTRSMRADEIKARLDSMGVRNDDCFEKSELAAPFEEAVARQAQHQQQGSPDPSPSDAEQEWVARAATQAGSGGGGAASSAGAAVDEVKSMRVSDIKQELDERGVDYFDLLEKAEYVERLADARAKGTFRRNPSSSKTSTSSGTGTGSAGRRGSTSSAHGSGRTSAGYEYVYDPTYRDVAATPLWRHPEADVQGFDFIDV